MKLTRLLSHSFIITVLIASACMAGEQGNPLTATEAAQHVGDTITVQAVVASTDYLERSKGQPTFLNLDKPFPNSPLAVAIWGEDRAKFTSAPEQAFKDKTVAVTGKVVLWHGKPQIAVSDPSQIRVISQGASSSAPTVVANQ